MIWLRLKLDLLPCISQEVDKVSKDYMGYKFPKIFYNKN